MFYGWVIVLVSGLTMFLVMGTRLSFGVFYSSILAEMGWSRGATAGIFSVSMLVYAVVAPGVGAAFDRWGPRRLFPVAAVLLGAGFFLCSRMTTLWQFYLYYGVIGGTGFTALTRSFWALFGVIFAIAGTVMLLTVHQNQYLIDSGFPPAFAAWMLGLSGLLRSGGSLLWGVLSDHMTRETSFTWRPCWASSPCSSCSRRRRRPTCGAWWSSWC
jgi:MFS family permease